VPDDDADDPTTLTDDAERGEHERARGAGLDDEARPPGSVVQLRGRRTRRRRGSGRGSGAEATGPAGRWSDDVVAGDHEPAGGPDPAAGEHGADRPDDAASGGAAGPDGTAAGKGSATSDGVIELTTVRGRRGRGGVLGDGPAGGVADGGDGAPDGDAAADPLAAALHPRMRSRRIAVLRSEGLRRLRRLTWGLTGLALLVDGVALAHTGFVDVDRFEIVGSPGTPASAVQHASGIHEGDALLTLDEVAAERRIEALPWVAEADVVRQWPGTVRITVVERRPSAVLQVSDDPAAPLALVDATGRVLDIGAHPEGLIAVTQVPPGLEEGGRVAAPVRDALRIAEAASQRMPGAIVSLTVGLEATLGSGGVVLFGSADDLDAKLMALSTVLARVDLECLEALNLAVPDHPALRRSC
jgi:cell division protein FtsQ